MNNPESNGHHRAAKYAALAGALAAAGIAEEFTRRRHKRRRHIPEEFNFSDYRELISPLNQTQLPEVFRMEVNVIAAVLHDETDRHGELAMTVGSISARIRELQLPIKAEMSLMEIENALGYLRAYGLVERVDNPRYTSGDDDDFAYQTGVFVPESTVVKREIAPIFYDTLKLMDY